MTTAPLSPLDDISSAISALVAANAPSIVSVHSRRSWSSGFVWRPGLIVTADEALAHDGEATVTLPGGPRVSAQIVGRDATTDVALLRVDSSTPPAALAASAVTPGALTVVIGAESCAPTAALGIVSRTAGPWHSMRGGEIDALIELSVGLRHSSEGGLVLDAAGRPLGMAVFGPRQRVLVIPAATIERVATSLEQHGRIGRGYVGLGLQQVGLGEGSGSGVMVMSLDPSGPGQTAGLKQGDVLITWNGEPVPSAGALARRLGPASVGQTVALGLRRGGQPLEVNLTISERSQP
jgi:S1-C subfamily serine protease